MTSKSMRSFAGGLIVAAGLCGAVYFFGPSEATGTQTVKKISEDEMKSRWLLKGMSYIQKKNGRIRLITVKQIKLTQ